LFKWFARTRKRQVSLEKLAGIWLGSPAESRVVRLQTTDDPPGAKPFQTEPKDNLPTENTEVSRAKQPFQSPEIVAFVESYVNPYAKAMGQTALDAIGRILRLLEIGGNGPSVVTGEGYEDEEAKDLNLYELLAQVTLLDHSLNVAREAVNLIRQSYPNFELITGKTLLAALSHDLGKIPSENKYLTGSHPIRGSQIVGVVVKNLSYSGEIVKAVRNHHLLNIKDQPLTALIREADHRARRTELQGLMLEAEVEHKNTAIEGQLSEQEKETPKKQGVQAQPSSKPLVTDKTTPKAPPSRASGNEIDLSWFKISKLIKEVGKFVNSYIDKETGKVTEIDTGRWRAFSFKDGFVYVMPNLLGDTVRALAVNERRADIVIKTSGEGPLRDVERAVTDKCRAEGMMSDEISLGYVGARYKVYLKDRKKPLRGFYTVFKAEVFGDLEQLEKRKRGTLAAIEKVEKIIPQAK